MISIVTSTYNRYEKLIKCIESVQAQTYKDYEHIIIDDHSSDKTEEIVNHYAKFDKRIKYQKLPKRFGNDTRPKNLGISLSEGEYIAFLDDDNQYRPDHLSALLRELERNPDVSMVYGDRWLIDQDGQIKPQIGIFHDYDAFLLLRRNYIDTSDVLIRREALFQVGGFDERYDKYIDWNLWVRLVKGLHNFKHIPLIITDYYLHGSSKSKRKTTKKEKEYMEKTGQSANIPDWEPADVEIRLPYLGPVAEPRVAIYSITYDRLDYTKTCFESLYKTTDYPFDHYVVDNGSTDGTVEHIKGKNYACIFNKENVGISKASNQAIEAIQADANSYKPYDIIVKVDNDCYFHTPGWLKKMVEIWKVNNRIALSCYIQGLKDNPGGAPRQAYGQILDQHVGMTNHLGGICHFVDARAYKNWEWDEKSFLHGMQDLEFSQHLASQGFQMAYLENYFSEHWEGTDGQHARYPEYFERRKHEKTTRYQSEH